jgi:ferredoxin
MSKIIIERGACIGCASCSAVCPKYFEMAEDGKSQIIGSIQDANGNNELETDKIECAENAADNCPVQCIKVIK